MKYVLHSEEMRLWQQKLYVLTKINPQIKRLMALLMFTEIPFVIKRIIHVD